MPDDVVSEVVTETVGCVSEAIALQLGSLLTRTKAAPAKLADALDFGYDADLHDLVARDQKIGFDHAAINKIFRQRFRSRGLRSELSQIGAADFDRSLYTLSGIRPKESSDQLRDRTRVSALLLQSLRDARKVLSRSHATTRAEDGAITSIPSPLKVARQILSDPDSEPSRVYANSALMQLLCDKINAAHYSRSDISLTDQLDYRSIADALSVIGNRSNTSKPIIANLPANGPVLIFVCNLLALHGQLVLRLELSEEALTEFRNDPWPFLLGVGSGQGRCGFWADPQFVELFDVGDILNIVHGLPLPVEGAGIVFNGGLRLGQDMSVVAAMSGGYGTGKTSICLSVAAALAPLGCRTLFLSCEEGQLDVKARLLEAAPDAIVRGVQLFKSIQPRRLMEEGLGKWFSGGELRRSDDQPKQGRKTGSAATVSVARTVADVIRAVMLHAEIFEPFRQRENGEPLTEGALPFFARRIIIIDGLHQLFDEKLEPASYEQDLQKLVEECRRTRAIVLITSSDRNEFLERLDFLCDVVIELDREGFEQRTAQPVRIFRLHKARRQPARSGSHIFNIHGPKGFRLKPMLSARTDETKRRTWAKFDDNRVLNLTDVPFIQDGAITDQSNIFVQAGSHVLVIGKGSSGKAGFGLFLLHRRPIDIGLAKWLQSQGGAQLELLDFDQGQVTHPKYDAFLASGLPLPIDNEFLESRVLVLSFLYQDEYYKNLAAVLGKRRSTIRNARQYFKAGETLPLLEHTYWADRSRTETISLYPGGLTAENLLAKVESALEAAEARGLPFTGVLIDGLHNVFVQYPVLERESDFWPELYSILRRRPLTVLTTFTKFELVRAGYQHLGIEAPREQSEASSNRHSLEKILELDFERAQRQAAPLLTALVSGADYIFDLSAIPGSKRVSYRLHPVSALGQEFVRRAFWWDRQKLSMLDRMPDS